MSGTRTFGRWNAPGPKPRALRREPDDLETADPSLGRSLLKDWTKYLAAASAAAVVVALLVGGGSEGETTEVAAAPAPPAPVKCGATLAEFYEVRPGMTYQEVRDIIGCEGELFSQMTIMNSNHATVRWESQTARYGSMTASFRDGSLVSRMQFNLK